MDKEKIENLLHILKHDLRIEVQSSLTFIEFMIKDLKNKEININEINRNLNILKETFKNMCDQINDNLVE